MKLSEIGLLLALFLGGVVAAENSETVPSNNPELRLELLQRAKADQEVRDKISYWIAAATKFDSIGETNFESTLDETQKAEWERLQNSIEKVDVENTKRLREIIALHGWPTRTKVGKDGAFAAWLIVQHADRSPEFQRHCLDLIVKLPKGEIRGQDIAYLMDRVLLAEGKRQIYGTQFTLENGKFIPEPLEDAENVDKLRAEVGLPPIDEYSRKVKSLYSTGTKN